MADPGPRLAASDAGIAWAQSILDQHARVPAILTTHDLAYADDAGEAALSTRAGDCGTG